MIIFFFHWYLVHIFLFMQFRDLLLHFSSKSLIVSVRHEPASSFKHPVVCWKYPRTAFKYLLSLNDFEQNIWEKSSPFILFLPLCVCVRAFMFVFVCRCRTTSLHLPSHPQVVYRETWQGRTRVLETNKTSVELQVPSGEEEDYLIQIKVLTDGGVGGSSGPIRIPKMSSKAQRPALLTNIGRRKSKVLG